MRRLLRWQRAAVQVAYDAACWTVALMFATALRYDLDLGSIHGVRLMRALPVAVGIGLGAGYLFGLYRRRWSSGSFEEVAALLRATIVATALFFVVNMLLSPLLVPRSTPIATGITA